MSEPKRLTAEELAERLSWLQINTHPATAWKTFEEIKGCFAALEAELAECKAAESLLMDELARRDEDIARLRRTIRDAKDDADGTAIEARWAERQGEDYGTY